MEEFAGKRVRAFVIWEPVLPTDWSSPSTAALRRISDTRAAQFWDKGRLISHSMGEHDRGSVVWDYVAVYPAGPVWEDRPPQAALRWRTCGSGDRRSARRFGSGSASRSGGSRRFKMRSVWM